MFELTVRRTFAAAHAIVMRGVSERIHGHNWVVIVTVAGDALDSDGLLCDFHALEATLDEAVSPFQNRSLNEVPPFDRVNPTAENLAEYIALEVGQRLPAKITVERVSVEEAVGCVAVYVAPAITDAGVIEAKPSATALPLPDASAPAPAAATGARGSSATSTASSASRSRRR